MRYVWSTLFWTFVVVTSLLIFPVALIVWLVTLPFGPRRIWLHRLTCFWASIYTWVNPLWSVRVEGREHIRPGVTYVMVANHLSIVDILVMFRLFADFKWVSKAEVFKAPIIGWNMSLNGYIPVKRGQRTSVEQMMAKCRHALRTGSSLMIFPEGTWSTTGQMRPFKPGAFELATTEHVPVLPIVMRGTGHAMPAKGITLSGHNDISITVLPEVSAAQVDTMTLEQLSDHVRGLIAAEQARDGQV